MASAKNLRREASLAIVPSHMRGLEWNLEYRHSQAKGDAAPKYVEIPEDVNHHREIETELQALGYEHAWHRKRWRVWRDNQYVADVSPELHQEVRPAEKPSASTPSKDGPVRSAATLNNLLEVA